jgi:uncharacterized membrane protein
VPRWATRVVDVAEIRDKLLGQVLVSANCSLTRTDAAVFFGVTAVASLLIAGALAVHGFWPVLPFAGVELFALGVALGLSLRRGQHREVISVYRDRVVIEKGAGTVEETLELPRHWARIELERPRWRGHPSRLFLGCHGKRWEIGAVLTEAERERLSRRLVELISDGAVPGAREQRPEANDLG